MDEKLYTYKIKFQFGKMPYYVWVDAADEDAAKIAAKRKVRGTYGRSRQYTHLSTELIGEAETVPEEPTDA